MTIANVLSALKLVSVEPVLLLYMMVIFIETNAIQELIYVKSCLALNHPVNETECSHANKGNQTAAVQVATMWNKYYSLCLFGLTFVSSLYAGSWSDRLGRKIPMLIPAIGTAIAASVNTLLSVFIHTHVAFLFVSSVISGVTFGTAGIVATAFGYISDHSEQKSRTNRIVILEAMLILGSTLGKYLGGAFMKPGDYTDQSLNSFAQLFIFEGITAVVICIYISLRIPRYESSVKTCKELFSVHHVADSARTVFRYREDGKREKVLLMLLAFFFVNFALVVQVTLGYYYTKKTLQWTLVEYTHYSTLESGLQGGMLLIGLPLLLHTLAPSDYVVGMLGMLSRTAGLVLFGLSTTPSMIFSCAGLYIFSEFPIPALRSLLSKMVDPDEKGRIFAFTAIIQGVGWLIGSFALMTIFTEFSFAGLCFEVVAGLQILSLTIFIYLYFTRKTLLTHYETIINEDGIMIETCSVTSVDPSLN